MRNLELLTYVLILVTFVVFYNCSSNSEFIYLGEAEGRPENFNVNIEVTTENIKQLYQKYDVFELLDGEYYLIRSTQSFTNSRYLSRLIKMEKGKQVAAKTFYDCFIDTCFVLGIGNRLVVGLNSLQINNYNPTSNKCKIIVLRKNLSPITGKVFSCKNSRTHVEFLMCCADSTFVCSIAIGTHGYYQFRARNDFSIIDSSSVAKRTDYYYIVHKDIDFMKQDWGNDMSDEEIALEKAQKEMVIVGGDEENKTRNDSLPTIEFVPQNGDSVTSRVDSSKQNGGKNVSLNESSKTRNNPPITNREAEDACAKAIECYKRKDLKNALKYAKEAKGRGATNTILDKIIKTCEAWETPE